MATLSRAVVGGGGVIGGRRVPSVDGDRYEPVIDAILRGEIELLADVIAAAGQVDDQLTNEQLDQILGVARRL